MSGASAPDSPSSPSPKRSALWLALALVGAGLVLVLATEEVAAPLAPGSPAPTFALAAQGSGATVTLADQQGKVVLLNFWATWCKPCEDEMPAMERLYQSLHGEPFEMLAISVDEASEDVDRFRERLGISFPILLDPDQATSRRYQTTGYPESLLIDRQGRLVQRYIGPRDWDAPAYEERIRALFAPEPG